MEDNSTILNSISVDSIIKARFSMITKKRGKGQLNLNNSDANLPVVDINERFVDACENGDYPTVSRILESIKDFNIDVTDNLGRTALRLAVENEHLEVVQALLTKSDSSKMREALLLSIYLGHTQIAESILKHPKYKILNDKKFLNGDTDSFWQTPSSDDAQFPPDITPIMLASQYNRTEIVQILLINGDRITKPHDFHCKCNECLNRFKFDSLRHAQSRLNAFRGLASEAYISLASIDPILTSFELGYELRMLSAKEKYFKNEYLELADNLSSYVCKLLNNVRGRDELEIVLNKTGKETEEKYERLARLDLAIKYEEKPFVAHSNCQQKLVEIWFTGIRKVSKMNQIFVLLLILLFIFLLPFTVIVYIVAPKSKIGRFMYQPFVKFLSHTISYMIFIILLIVSSVKFSSEQMSTKKFSDFLPENLFDNYTTYANRDDLEHKFDFVDFYIRMDEPSEMDIAITIWIIGLIWQESKNIYHYGIKDYLRSWKNIVNSAMNILYLSSFGLKFYTMILVRLNKEKVLSSQFWKNAVYLNQSNIEEQNEVANTLYWLNNDRYFWVSMDPINMAEGLFAVANLFSFTRICFLLPANQQLGPLQISLGNMISDITKFLFIFLIIFLAFMFALNNLFWYYQTSIRKKVQANTTLSNKIYYDEVINAEKKFGTIPLTFQTMFWSLFGLGDPDNVTLGNYKNDLTEVFGSLLYGTYHIASVLVLLNMLVASMTQSFEKILQESDVEWKFSRSKLYMEYIRQGGTLPVPFNIIPTPKSFYQLIKRLVYCFKKKKQPPKQELEMPSIRQGKRMQNPVSNGLQKSPRRQSNAGDELTYIKVMQRIVKRFLLHKQRETDDFGEADFEELKQDLQMVRFEMMNDLKRSREETARLVNHINYGVCLIGEEIFKDSQNENSKKFREFKSTEYDYNYSVDQLNDFSKQEVFKGSNEIVVKETNVGGSDNTLSPSTSANELLDDEKPKRNLQEQSSNKDQTQTNLQEIKSSQNKLNDSIKSAKISNEELNVINDLTIINEEEEEDVIGNNSITKDKHLPSFI